MGGQCVLLANSCQLLAIRASLDNAICNLGLFLLSSTTNAGISKDPSFAVFRLG
jgi:hypothetical protein